MKISKPRGTRDFLPEETTRRRHVENIMRQVVNNWGYHEIITPTFEKLDLFTLKSGEGVVGELYNFMDKGNREMTLRPELTAPVMRMYVNGLQANPRPLKLFYFENCFRYERPQKGRYREFWQFGVEVIGSKLTDADAEIIALASEMIRAVGIQGDLHVGHLGI
ncbi:MAG: histidine--tRNA ligase, partial [Methanosarcinaceae archaeon]